MFPCKTIMTVGFCLLFMFVVSDGKAEDPKNLDLAVTLVRGGQQVVGKGHSTASLRSFTGRVGCHPSFL